MLKTQISKAFFLCLFYFVVSSFAPAAHYTVATSDNATDEEMPPAVASANMVYAAPKVKLNKQALQFADHYIKTSQEDLVSIKKRSSTPFSIMDAIFSRYGLPVELKYLAVIESELKTSALSHVGALGPWQLMPETAQDLGLKITRQYDERTSYYKSTKAAALYLRDLYGKFGDWLLVLAAYNAGPKPVINAIRKSGSRNFWALQNFLPAETRGHVKRFIATHYYFEGHGSVTTLTKAENIEYRKSVNTFALAHSGIRTITPGIVTTGFSVTGLILPGLEKATPSSVTRFGAAENNVLDNAIKEVRFKRLMKESEKSLQKSNKAIEG